MKTKNKFKSQVVLGRRYRDDIVSIEGTAVIVSFHLHACEQVTLEYLGKDGKSEFHTVDVARLIDIESEAKLEPEEAKATGSTTRPVASRHRPV